MSREHLIPQLISLFRQFGYEGTTLARISAATGLGKASLYHYFPGGKEDMAKAVLDYLNVWRSDNVVAALEADAAPLERLQGMMEALRQVYADGRQSCLLSVLSMGEFSDRFSPQIRPAFKTLIESVAKVVMESGIARGLARERAEDAILQIQGALVLSRALDDNTPFMRITARLPEELLRRPTG